MTSLVQVIQIIEAVKRKPEYLKKFTFFSDWDLWRFEALSDDRLCKECESYDGVTYLGSKIRLLFPDLVIYDQNIINPRVHPNCRCSLYWTGSVEGGNRNR